MRLTFDPNKNNLNIAKHGVSLALAEELDWESALIWPDERKDYGEIRMIALALLGTRVFNVVFTERGDTRRIVSLRKANSREVIHYASEN
jgi:uncharacterized protein